MKLDIPILFSDLGEFVPTGDLWTRLSRNYNRLEEEKYWPENVFQREVAHEGWPGDTEGRTLLAWVLLAQATGRAPRHLEQTLRNLPDELNGSNYFGKIYIGGISEQQLSGHGWVLRSLAEMHRWSGTAATAIFAKPIIENLILPTAGRYANYPIDPADLGEAGEYSGSQYKQLRGWLLSTDVGTVFNCLDGIVDIYDVLEDNRLKPIVEEMISRFLEIDLAGVKAQTHASLTACRSILRWADIMGDSALVDAVEERYLVYADQAMTEHHANFNWFNRPEWTEPCAIVDSIMVAMELWRHTENSRYLEDAHLIYFNGLGHAQRFNGGFGLDNCPGTDGSDELRFTALEAHWCCTMRGAEGLARMTQYCLAVKDRTLMLPFLLPGETIRRGVHLVVDSSYPLGMPTEIRATPVVNTEQQIDKISVFVPSWITNCRAESGLPGEHDTIEPEGQWMTLPIAGQSTWRISGQLVEESRPVRNKAFVDAAHSVYYKGPLVLATNRGERVSGVVDVDKLEPIFTAYTEAVTDTTESHRQILFDNG
jgi:hypothetical protein